MLKRRLLVAQGPQQLLLGMACLRQRAEQAGENYEVDDTLILGDFMATGAAAGIDATCRVISKQHPFSYICSTHDLDGQFYEGTIQLADYMAGVLRLLGCRSFDEVITCRNMQSLNEVVLHAFPQAHKVTIGDGIGIIDNNSIRFAWPILPVGYLPIDEIQTLLPVEAEPGAFCGLPIGHLKPSFYVNAVHRAAEELEVATTLCRFDPTICESPTTLLLMANLTESGHAASIEDELNYFTESALPYLEKGSRVWVKGHPRHCHGQPALLTQRLRCLGFNSFSDPGIDTLPSECIATVIPVSRLLAFRSSTCITWRLLKPETPIVIGAPQAIAERYLRTPDAFRTGVSARYIQTAMVSLGRFDPISRQAIRDIQEHVSGWVVEMPPASRAGDFGCADLVQKITSESLREFADTATRPPSDRHAREKISKDERAILAVLALDCCAGERARLLEQVKPAISAADQKYNQLNASREKMGQRLEKVSHELQQIQDTWSWRCLRWLFKIEHSIRRRAMRSNNQR